MTDTLAIAAEKAPTAKGGKRNTDRWLPACAILRRKGYSYESIHAFLRKQGEDVHPCVSTFASAMSKRYRHWLDQQTKQQTNP